MRGIPRIPREERKARIPGGHSLRPARIVPHTCVSRGVGSMLEMGNLKVWRDINVHLDRLKDGSGLVGPSRLGVCGVPLTHKLGRRPARTRRAEADAPPHPTSFPVLGIWQVTDRLATRLASILHLRACIQQEIARRILVGVALRLCPATRIRLVGVQPGLVVVLVPLCSGRAAFFWIPNVAMDTLQGVPLRVLGYGRAVVVTLPCRLGKALSPHYRLTSPHLHAG